MKVSIITVCFNSAQTIERSLLSVKTQDWSNIEHIVIDGASDDATLEILHLHKVSLSHLVSEPDSGIYDAMNKGLKLATGDVICFLNADDYYSSSSVISHVVRRMQDDNLDAFFGDVGFFKPKSCNYIYRRYSSAYFRPDRISWGWMPAHPALFLRRRVVSRVGFFKTDYKIAGDFEYIVRIFYSRHVDYRYDPIIFVHMQAGGSSTRNWRSKLLLNHEVLRACYENGVNTNLLKIISKYPVKILGFFRK
jgi:glycosyltransferase involved in cell wall biosynthesis